MSHYIYVMQRGESADSFTFNTYEERIYGEAAGYAISLNEVEGFISAKILRRRRNMPNKGSI